MIRIATDLELSPDAQRLLVKSLRSASRHAEGKATSDDGRDVLGAIEALATAVSEARQVSSTAVASFGGDNLKLDRVSARGGKLVRAVARQAAEAGIPGRLVRVEVALVFVDDGEG